MKLTGSVNYAIGILLQVATGSGDAPLTAAKIARGCRFPPRFLYRILRRLVDADLLEGTSGPGGGYRLAKPPQNVTLLDVVTAADARPEASRLRPVKASHQKAVDLVNAICNDSAARFSRDLRRAKLSDLVEAQAPPPKAKKSRGKAVRAAKPRARKQTRKRAGGRAKKA